jgi:hypothetical protein
MADCVQDIFVNRIDGTAVLLGDYSGKVVLVVNLASKCGLTLQYDGLEALYETYRDHGFVVAGFPANEFAGQEPGSNAEIAGSARPVSTSNSRCSRRSWSRARASTRSIGACPRRPRGRGRAGQCAEGRRGVVELREVPGREGRIRGGPVLTGGEAGGSAPRGGDRRAVGGVG